MSHCGFNQDRRFALGIVIVNYRTPELVEACLRSLESQLEDADAVVVIVDNASGDGSVERLAGYCAKSPAADRLRVIAAPDNRGFSSGNNIGVSAVSSDLVLLLNSDAIARPGALKALIDGATATPEASIFTPCIVSGGGELLVSRFRRHSVVSELVDGAQAGPVTRLFRSGEVPIFPDDTETEPDWVSFCAVMIRRAAIDKAGPMDEGFFLYYEDCEYCLRLRNIGARIKYVSEAMFEHDAGASTKLKARQEAGERLPAYYYRSRSRYYRLLYGPAGPLAANLAWYSGRAIARIRGLAGKPAPRVAKGWSRDIWISWI